MQTAQLSDANRMPAVRSRRRGAIPLIAATASLAALAGCGSSSPARPTAQLPQKMVTAAFKYSGCMRNHGVTNFPDPQVITNPGQQAIRQALPISVAQSPQFKAAQKACRGIMPMPNANPAQVAQQQRAREQDLLAFARCLRSHGVSDFPDPTSQGQLTLEMVDAAGVDLHSPALLSAAKACIGVTHGAITGADVERAVNRTQ
jgi:hypothetical protein